MTFQLPPGPQAGRLAQTVGFHRDPLGTLQRARERHGTVFTMRMATTGPLVAVATPEGVARIPGTDPDPGHAGEARRQILGMVSKQSILGADDDVHRRARGRVRAVFEHEALAAHRAAMERIAARRAAEWPRGRPFRVLPRMREIADDIFASVVFGVRDPDRARALSAAVRRMLFTPGNPPVSPTGEGAGLMGALVSSAFERRKRPAADLLGIEIDERRRAGDAGELDVIGCMLRDGPDRPTADLVDELLPLLMAGQEPPAAGLTWLLDRLARTPGAAERFAAASDADPWRDAFVKETFRLRPPVHTVARRLKAPFEIAGLTLPPHAVPMVPVPLVHRDPETFPDPDAFRPERHLDGDTDRMLLPFGGGPRRCLGEHLAHHQIAAVIPAILGTVRLRAVWPQTEKMVVRGTVLVPHRSGLMLATGR